MGFLDGLEGYAARDLAIGDDGRRWRYDQALELAVSFARQPVRRRLVLCLCANDPGTLLGYLALRQCDAVPALLNASIADAQLAVLVATYRPAFIWLPRPRSSQFSHGREVARCDTHVLLHLGDSDASPIHDDLALLLSTSGSTGSPVFVRQSHRNLASNAGSIAGYLGIAPEERPITTLPFSYTYGLSIIHSHVLHGCTLLLTERGFFDRGFWDFFKAESASSFGGVPYHYEILRKLRFWRMELPSLRTLTQAGGRMDPGLALEMARECAPRGIRYFAMYGQAEATARMAYLAPERAVAKAGSIGTPIPGGEFWLEDEDGRPVDTPDTSGQLVYRGANVTLGYAHSQADLGRGDDNKGLLHTGDLARRDADGDYYITGRLKRFLKLFGHRVNLQDVEDLLRQDGHDVACGGQDDQLRIYATRMDGETAARLKARISSLLKAHPSAVSVIGIEALPRSDAGKIRFRELEALPGEILA